MNALSKKDFEFTGSKQGKMSEGARTIGKMDSRRHRGLFKTSWNTPLRYAPAYDLLWLLLWPLCPPSRRRYTIRSAL